MSAPLAVSVLLLPAQTCADKGVMVTTGFLFTVIKTVSLFKQLAPAETVTMY